MKGYIDKTNVVLSSRKFKKFEYPEDCLKENPIDKGSCYIKIEAEKFYRFIKLLNKLKLTRLTFETNREDNKYFKLFHEKELIKIPVIYPIEENAKCKYSIEYLINILKEYKIKDFKNEFIELWFEDDSPLKIKFKKDWVILAPCIK